MSECDDCVEKAEPPPTLYHYTKWSGFTGICGKGQLWLTHFDCLNDRKELGYAIGLFSDLVTEPTRTCAAAAIADLGRLQYACVASLTEEGDLLSQWQAYGDKGAGICVGFASAALSALCNGKDPSNAFTLRRVMYEPAEQVRALCSRIESCPKPPEHDPASGCSSACPAYKHHLHTLECYALTLKDPHWREEREWRLIHLSSEPPPNVRPEGKAAYVECPPRDRRSDGSVPPGLVPERLILGPMRSNDTWGSRAIARSALVQAKVMDPHDAARLTVLQSRVPLR